jgi:nucleotide-binding universal stress UspA family protein
MNPRPGVELEIADGRPFQTLRAAAEHSAMLVVGVDTAYWAGPLSGGSVTERLITRSNVPVAVVPERSFPGELSGPIFVAIDTRSPAAGPLRFAFMEADRTTHELHVAHIIPTLDMFYGSQSHKIAVSEVLAGWCEEFPDVTVKHRFFFDDADDGCIRASEEASLLVLGHRKSHVFGHPVLAEIAKRVHCPCVVVPDEWEVR